MGCILQKNFVSILSNDVLSGLRLGCNSHKNFVSRLSNDVL